MTDEEALEIISEYRGLLVRYEKTREPELRRQLNEKKAKARDVVIQAGEYRTYTVSPPPIVGGLIHRNVDPFDSVFSAPYGQDFITPMLDMLDATVGSIDGGSLKRQPQNEPIVRAQAKANYAFIAMAIGDFDKSLVDTLDAIKETARDLGIQAERIDEQQSNEGITNRILESIRSAEFVIVDLTHEKPNVYYEAGFANALGKTPIYIAKSGTVLHFDVKDFPVIFWSSYRELKDQLRKRIEGIVAARQK